MGASTLPTSLKTSGCLCSNGQGEHAGDHECACESACAQGVRKEEHVT